MQYKFFVLFFLLTLIFLNVTAQDIQIVDGVLDEPNNTIEVIYNLEGNSKDTLFSVSLFYSNDGGITFNGPVERVSGDVGPQIRPGSYKKIYWNYFYEDGEFTGENLVFLVRAREITAPLPGSSLMGPKAALFSVVIPGWGDYKVRNGKNYWLFTAGTWGLLGAGLIARSGASTAYDEYLIATDVPTADKAFKEAEGKFGAFKTLSTIAIVAWAADVVGVYIKGKQNQRNGLTAGKYQFDWDLALSPVGNTAIAGIKVKF